MGIRQVCASCFANSVDTDRVVSTDRPRESRRSADITISEEYSPSSSEGHIGLSPVLELSDESILCNIDCLVSVSSRHKPDELSDNDPEEYIYFAALIN